MPSELLADLLLFHSHKSEVEQMAKQHFLQGGYTGKLGETIGYERDAKFFVKRYAIPANPRTPQQQSNRSKFSIASGLMSRCLNYNRGFGLWPSTGALPSMRMVGQAKAAIDAGADPSLWPPAVPSSGATLAISGTPTYEMVSHLDGTITATIPSRPAGSIVRAIAWSRDDAGNFSFACFQSTAGAETTVNLQNLSYNLDEINLTPFLAFFAFYPLTPSTGTVYSSVTQATGEFMPTTKFLSFWNHTKESADLVIAVGDNVSFFGEYFPPRQSNTPGIFNWMLNLRRVPDGEQYPIDYGMDYVASWGQITLHMPSGSWPNGTQMTVDLSGFFNAGDPQPSPVTYPGTFTLEV